MTPEQERLFIMLEELVTICRDHGLRYYVAGGTTLGAVRHGGFIPWDDDVDIMMPRTDWARLVEIAREGGLPAGRVLNCLELDVAYPHVFGRYTDITSCSLHYNQLLGGTPEGFIIDIFILDPVPDAHNAFDQHRKTLSLYNDLANDVGYSYPMSQDRALLEQYAKRIEHEGRRAVLAELDAELSKYDESTSDYLVMRWAAAPRLFKTDLFAYERYENFEGLAVQVPAKCNDYLVQHYGDDWMYMPSKQGRVVHDTISFLDVDYKTFQDDYLPFIDVKRARKAFLNRRAYHIRHMADLNRASDLKAGIYSSFAKMVTLKRAASSEDLYQALSDGRFGVLDRVFAEFYRRQNDPELSGREEYLTINRYYDPIYIDIGDELLSLAILNLLDTNRVAQANRILRVRELAKGSLTNQLLHVKRLIELVRLPSSLKDVGCHNEALELSRYIMQIRPNNFSNRVFLAEELYQRKRFDELAGLSAESLKLFPRSGEFMKYAADCHYAREGAINASKDAGDEYAEALMFTTHFGILSDVRTKVQENPALATSKLSARLDEAVEGIVQGVPGQADNRESEEIAAHVFKLLQELDDMCERKGIDRFLGPDSCRLASVYGNNAKGMPALDLLVPASQFSQLVDAVLEEGNPNRAVDCWTTNKNHLSYQLDYVDKTTTFMQLDEGFNITAHGVKVTVTPIRALLESGKASRLDMLETGWEINGYQLTKRITGRRIAAAAFARAGMVLGRKNLANHMYRAFNREYGTPPGVTIPDATASAPTNGHGTATTGVMLRFPNKQPFMCSAHHFNEYEVVEFCGRAFRAPIGYRDLLAQFAGKDWETATRDMAVPYKNTLISSELPYEDLLAQLDADGNAADKLFSLMKRIRISMLPLTNDLRIRNQVMNIAARSGERKRCYDFLEEHKSEIQRCLAENDFETLDVLLGDYEKAATLYLSKGLGLCPSKEYLDLLCDRLRCKGENAKADKLERLAPPAHYRPLGA